MLRRVKVLTVVVAYNPYRAGFFPRCLHAIQQVNLVAEDLAIDHQILVVDNNSVDGTRERLRQEFPQIEVHFSAENVGYAGGNNIGFEKAQHYQADFVAVVTQDVIVDAQWLLEAIRAADTDPKIGVVQPLLLLWPQKELVNSVGNAIHVLGYGYARGYREPAPSYVGGAVTNVPYASGACLLIRASVLRDVGYFDEEMWMYNEDQDLGWRMWLMGYRNVLAPRSVAYHQYEFSRSISKVYFMDRNRILVMAQNYHWATWLLLLPAFALNEIATFILAYQGGWWREKVRVWRYFLRPSSWATLRGKRRLRQQQRIVGDRAILPLFTGRILFQDVQSPVIAYIANPVLQAYYQVLCFLVRW